jgi:hypothetical protein
MRCQEEVWHWPEITLRGLPIADHLILEKSKHGVTGLTICVMATLLAAPFGRPGLAAMDR